MTRERRRQRGMTLIEVLIALLLLSFGLMGMIGLKAIGLKHTGQANVRALASLHATDILDRMRANPVRAAAGDYNLAQTAPAPTATTTVAQVDLAQWRRDIGNNLPGGSGSVLMQANGIVRIVLQWTERVDTQTDPQAMSFTFEGRL